MRQFTLWYFLPLGYTAAMWAIEPKGNLRQSPRYFNEVDDVVCEADFPRGSAVTHRSFNISMFARATHKTALRQGNMYVAFEGSFEECWSFFCDYKFLGMAPPKLEEKS